MNRIILDKELGGFLLVETKFGNIFIEQAGNETCVKFIENEKIFENDNSSHLEDKSTSTSMIICMVKDE
jgi:hypothetical protein